MFAEFLEPLPLQHQPITNAMLQATRESADLFFEVLSRRNHQLRRCRRSRGPQVSDKVGDGEIGLMANGGDEREFRRSDYACQPFIVESGEVFERAASPRDDYHIYFARLVEVANTRGDFAWGCFPLNLSWIYQQPSRRVSSPQYIQNVVNCRSARRGHNTDTPRQGRNRLLTRLIKQPFDCELRFELLERNLQRASALRLQIFGNKLKLAATLVHSYSPTREDLHAVVWTKSQETRLHSKHNYTKLSLTILQREVKMSRLRRTIVRDLAADPDVGVFALNCSPHHANQVTNSENASLRLESEAELFEAGHRLRVYFTTETRRHGETEKRRRQEKLTTKDTKAQ